MFYDSSIFGLIYISVIIAFILYFITVIIINFIKNKSPKNIFTKISCLLSLSIILITAIWCIFLVLKESDILDVSFLTKIYGIYGFVLTNLLHGILIVTAILCLVQCMYKTRLKFNAKKDVGLNQDKENEYVEEVIDNTLPIDDIFKELGNNERDIEAYLDNIIENAKNKIEKEDRDFNKIIDELDNFVC